MSWSIVGDYGWCWVKESCEGGRFEVFILLEPKGISIHNHDSLCAPHVFPVTYMTVVPSFFLSWLVVSRQLTEEQMGLKHQL